MCKLFFFLLFCSPLAEAQQPFVHEYWLNEYNTPVKVNAIIQDITGYIFVGTDAGVYRFNGRSFVLLSDSICKPVTALVENNGKVYVGYSNGIIAEVDNDSVHRLRIYGYVPATPVHSILIDGDVLFATTEEGIFSLFQNRSILLNSENGMSDDFAYCVYKRSTKQLLVGTDKGINCLSLVNNKLHIDIINSSTVAGMVDNIVTVIGRGNFANDFWIGTQNGGVMKVVISKKNKISAISAIKNWEWGQVNDILPYAENKAWVATEDGYILNIDLSNKTLPAQPYYLGKSIKKILLGKTGNIWCATTDGLTMLTTQFLTYIPLFKNYSLGTLTSMTCDKENNLWYAQRNKLYKMPLKGINEQSEIIYSAASDITSLYADTLSGIWIGTIDNGLWYWKDNKTEHVENIPRIEKTSILSIAGNKDNIWISSLNGVEQTKLIAPGKLQLIQHHSKRSGVGSDYIYQLHIDRFGEVWMATDGAGICMYDTVYHHWDSSNGIQSKVIYSITEDVDTNIWIGTLDKGLYFFDGKSSWISTHKKAGTPLINISTLAANNTGQVIVVHQKGIDEWYPLSHEFRHFGKRFLMPIDSVSTVLNCFAKDTAGNVYIPFNLGFMVFKNQDSRYDISPTVCIRSVSVFLQQIPEMQHSFSYNQNNITIAYDGINYTSTDPVHYRYLLEGYNNKWTYTDDELVTFPQLSPGKYTFNLESSLNKNYFKSSRISYSFVITMPFWKSIWFLLLVAIVIIVLVITYIRLRERQLKKISQLQKERMLYEYEHLKTQVNPHFLFNSLNTLASLIEEDRDAAIDYTTQLSDLYRHMLAYRERDLVLLAEEWEILLGYMYIQQSRFGKALHMQANIPADILRTKKIVPLSLQIVVENAIKHNIVSASVPLTIYISADENEIVIKNHLQPKISKERSSGLGLENIKKRYRLLSRKDVTYGIKNNDFIITLPLL